MERNCYNALKSWPDFARELEREARKAGAYSAGIESDSRGRGTAINVDLYGYDKNLNLIVVQVRQAVFRPDRYTRVRKNYLLVGRNEETDRVFTHPIDSPARSKTALASPEATVAYVLSKIWDCRPEDIAEIHRQGDIAFIPVRSIPKTARKVEGPIILRETHRITGDEIYHQPHTDTYYVAKRGHAAHTKRQHAPVTVRNGFFRVQAGNRARLWDFTERVGD